MDYVIDFPALLLPILTKAKANEELIEFEIISEFNTDLLLNGGEVTFQRNKLINFTSDSFL